MTRETNMATQERAAAHLNAGEVDAFVDTLFAVDALDHDPAPGQGPGREGFRAFFHTLTEAFPDAQLAPEVTVADDEHISFAYTLNGHHTGTFQGVEPTGNRVEVRGVQIGRFVDGRIVERWGSTDELGILQQIGAAPVNPEGDEPTLITQVKTALTPGS
ncbi:MAG: ester cyclase [Pseudonocardia sp.]|nr:ester cyclase [Pseudonocardia sp.]